MFKIPFLALIVLIAPAFASPTINEIMANPLNESNEWVEVYSAEQIDLSEWMIGDDNSNDTIICTNCIVSGYFLIIGNSGSISSINSSATYSVTDDSKVGNGLSNTADCVRFFSASATSSFCWNSTFEESSFTLRSDGSWVLCENSTPGGPNACDIQQQSSQASQNETQQVPQNEAQQQQAQPPPEQQAQIQPAEENIVLKAYLTADVYTGSTYEDLFKVVIKNKPDCSDKDNVKASFNISGEGTFYTSSWEREVGCSGYDGTGFWTPESAGLYTVCGEITETTAGDSEPSDNKVCWTITAFEVSNTAAPAEIVKDGNVTAEPQKPAHTQQASIAKETDEPNEAPEKPDQQPSKTVSFTDIFLMLVNILYKIGLLIR